MHSQHRQSVERPVGGLQGLRLPNNMSCMTLKQTLSSTESYSFCVSYRLPKRRSQKALPVTFSILLLAYSLSER